MTSKVKLDNLSTKEIQTKQREVMKDFRAIFDCATEAEAEQLMNDFSIKFHDFPELLNYMTRQWCGRFKELIGEDVPPNATTNATIESFHNKLKRRHSQFGRKQRPDVWVYKLFTFVVRAFRSEEVLVLRGVAERTKDKAEREASAKADALTRKEILEMVTRRMGIPSDIVGDTPHKSEVYDVKSFTRDDLEYHVTFQLSHRYQANCTCPYWINGKSWCKHVFAALRYVFSSKEGIWRPPKQKARGTRSLVTENPHTRQPTTHPCNQVGMNNATVTYELPIIPQHPVAIQNDVLPNEYPVSAGVIRRDGTVTYELPAIPHDPDVAQNNFALCQPPVYSRLPAGVPNHFASNPNRLLPRFPADVFHGVPAHQHPVSTQLGPLSFDQLVSTIPEVHYSRVTSDGVTEDTVQLTLTRQQGHPNSFGSFKPPSFLSLPGFRVPLINEDVCNRSPATNFIDSSKPMIMLNHLIPYNVAENHPPFELPFVSRSPTHDSSQVQTYPQIHTSSPFQTSDDEPSFSNNEINSIALEAAHPGSRKMLNLIFNTGSKIAIESDDCAKQFEEFEQELKSISASSQLSFDLKSKIVGYRKLNKRRGLKVANNPIPYRKECLKSAIVDARHRREENILKDMPAYYSLFLNQSNAAQKRSYQTFLKAKKQLTEESYYKRQK